MKQLSLFFLICAFFSVTVFAQVPSEEVLTPDTKLTLNDGDFTRNLTGKELWQELDQFEAEQKIKNNAKLVVGEDGQKELVIPMEPKVKNDLKLQHENFLTTAIDFIDDAPVPSVAQKDHFLDIGYNKVWGKKDRFAAYVDAKAKVYGSRETRKLHSHLYAGGYVFNQNVKAVEFTMDISNGKDAKATTSLRVFGKTKFSSSSPVVHKKIFFSGEMAKTARFFIGPVPISVRGAIGGSAGFDAKVSVLPTGLQGNVTPGVNTYGKADAGVDLWFVKAGVEGSLDLLIDHLPATLTVQLLNLDTLDIGLTVKNNLKALSGKISVFAKVLEFWKFWKKKWKKYSMTIFSWNGIQKNWTLFDRKLQVALK